MTQKGFSPLLIVVLLGAGIIAGTYLVQNSTNFLPKAAEQEPLNPSAGNTKNCSNETDTAGCIAENNVICARDTVTYCDNRQGSPRAIRKSGGYYEPTHANADPASGCVFDYREVQDKNSECGKSESKSGDVVYTTVDEAKKLDSDREKTRSEREKNQGSGTAATGASDAQCTDITTEKALKDEKLTGNLVRFYAILEGVPGYCVPADMGTPVQLKEKDVDGREGRVMLCSGQDGALVWRIIQGSKLVPATRVTPNDKSGVEAFLKDYTNKALELAK